MDQVPIHFLLSLPLVGAFAMFALGVVVIFQASRVLNLAHGAMVMVPPFVLYELSERGVPLLPGLVLAVASGAAIGAVVERLFVRGLRRQGVTGQTVGTVAALGLLVALGVKIWGTTPRTPTAIFPEGGVAVGASTLRYGQIGLCIVAIVATVALFALFRFTNLGLAMRVAADNRRAASLMGIDPDFTTRMAWLLGGALAALAGVLLAAVTTLHPINLALLVLPAFVAALIGGLGSLPGALVGAAVVGLVIGMVPSLELIPGLGGFATQVGAPQLVLTIVALVVMALRGTRFSGADVRAELDVGESTAAGNASESSEREHSDERRDGDEADQPEPVPRITGRLFRYAAVGLVIAFPFLGVPFSWLGNAINAAIILIVAVSLVLLTGWVGQISLAQASFMGIGAFSTALLARSLDIPFPASLPLAALMGAGAAVLLGVVALRVRGLYLAVATLIFLWMSNEYLFAQSWLVPPGGTAALEPQRIGDPNTIPYFDFTDRTTFYFVAVAVAAATLWGAANLRDSQTGRAFFAIRGSEVAAASLGIDVVRYKLLAFAISGFLAGVAGVLFIVNLGAAGPAQFGFTRSLFFLAVAVVGGLTSLGGAAAASILFAGLDELFFRVSALAGWLGVVSAGLLAVVLLVRPGGLASFAPILAALADRVRPVTRPVDRVLAAAAQLTTRSLRSAWNGVRLTLVGLRQKLPGSEQTEAEKTAIEAEPVGVVSTDGNGQLQTLLGTRAAGPRRLPKQRSRRNVVVRADDITVRFGGLVAVDKASLKVCEGEITGLIGPNGAGKTTLFNAISGLNVPTAGSVEILGTDVTGLPPHRRAALGLARTFQVIQLFPQLTVYDNLLVATHLQARSNVLGHLVVSKTSLEAEYAARVRVAQAIELLELREVAHRTVAGLPFGVLRMVEIARAIVTGAPIIMLDEPASGLDNTETARLADFLRTIRTELGLSLLLIEHDVAMVTSVSDYMYVLNRGKLIAEGTADEVQRNEEVIAAYLGRAETEREAVPV